MERIKAHKLRIYPNKSQIQQIEDSFSSSRYVYNTFLSFNKDRLEMDEYTLNYGNESKILTLLKSERTWLKQADKFSLQNALKDQDLAFKNFFQGRNGFPKFHSKRNSFQSYRTNLTNNNIKINNKYIKLPKLKWIKFSKHREIIGNIQNVTISRKNHKYYISITVKFEVEKLKSNNKYVGIDLGLKSFAYTKNNLAETEDIKNPKYLEKSLKKLKYKSKQLSRKQHSRKKGDSTKKSNRYKKQQKTIAKIHEKISNQRKDFLHKLSSKIISENQVIGIEDLAVSNMMKNKKLSRHIAQSGWRMFREFLTYKADWNEREIKVHNRFYTSSKTCRCGFKYKELKLHEREWTCKKCNAVNHRDELAAHNLIPMECGKSKHVEYALSGNLV